MHKEYGFERGSMVLNQIADYINVIGKFCGQRDLETLTVSNLKSRFQIEQADMLVLFGGTIPYGIDVAATAMQQGIAKSFMISGGVGHTTNSLREKIKNRFPMIITEEKSEAEIISAYLKKKYDITPEYIEEKSTNCGNNVSNVLEILNEKKLRCHHMIIMQDATMQKRMDACFQKYQGVAPIQIINFASYKANVIVKNELLTFADNTMWGMWDMETYISLLMGEIPRLMDNKDGYGPEGKAFIAHVEIPNEVLHAFECLKEEYEGFIRKANPEYASDTYSILPGATDSLKMI